MEQKKYSYINNYNNDMQPTMTKIIKKVHAKFSLQHATKEQKGTEI
jgi:hypothetical protein